MCGESHWEDRDFEVLVIGLQDLLLTMCSLIDSCVYYIFPLVWSQLFDMIQLN